jgi:hypothetical protein
MKLRHKLLTSALLALAAPAAFAQSFAELKAAGLLVPGSCTLALTNGGIVALGAINELDLDPQAETMLAPGSVNVAINCTAPTKVAAMITENRAGSSTRTGVSSFGLGKTSTGVSIGFYEAVAKTPVANGSPSAFITAPDTVGNLWATPSGDAFLEHGAGRKFLAFGTAAAGPSTVTTASLAIEVRPTIAPTTVLMLPAPETIDGSLTMDLVYL